MVTHIKVTDDSAENSVPIKRRNPRGVGYENISASIPKELSQTINGIVVKTKQSRSLVISELIEKGLKNRG